MWPDLIDFALPGSGDTLIGAAALGVLIGGLVAAWIATREAERRGRRERSYAVLIPLFIGAWIGSRAVLVVEAWTAGGLDEVAAFAWRGGGSQMGAWVGAFAALLVSLRGRGAAVRAWADAVALGAPAGIALGRVGCFVEGCCFGVVCGEEAGAGVVFPPSSPAAIHHATVGLVATGAASRAVHPVQLYLALASAIIFVVAVSLRRRVRDRSGALALVVVTLHLVAELAAGRLRESGLGLGNTVIALVGLLLAIVLWGRRLWPARRSVRRAEPDPEPEKNASRSA